MIVHLIDGTYELFRHFYGFRRTNLPPPALGAVAGVLGTIMQMLDEGAMTASGEGSPERLSHDYLLGLYGIGPYAAAHCRMLLHDFSRIPVDSSVAAYLRERHGCDPAAFTAEQSPWGDYLALGYRLTRLRDKLRQPIG